MNSSSSAIQLSRDVEAIQIPSGERVTLPLNAPVLITQALGGAYTVVIEGQGGLFRIQNKDADALGKEVEKTEAAKSNVNVVRGSVHVDIR